MVGIAFNEIDNHLLVEIKDNGVRLDSNHSSEKEIVPLKVMHSPLIEKSQMAMSNIYRLQVETLDVSKRDGSSSGTCTTLRIALKNELKTA